MRLAAGFVLDATHAACRKQNYATHAACRNQNSSPNENAAPYIIPKRRRNYVIARGVSGETAYLGGKGAFW